MSITRLSKMPFELNNNSELYESSYKRNRNESIVSVSSASSFHSDSSEDAEGLSRKSSIVQELTQKDNVLEVRRLYLQRVRALLRNFYIFCWKILRYLHNRYLIIFECYFSNNFALLLHHCL